MHRLRAGSSGSRPGEGGEGRGFLSTNQGAPIASAGSVPQFAFRGSTASPGARQALLLPPFRAGFRAAAGARDGRASCVGGAEVRVSELLLSAHDPRRLLWRPPVRGDGGRVGSLAGVPVLVW